MQEVLLFSGTSEGRRLAEILAAHQIPVTVCVATEYGREVMKQSELVTVLAGRRNQKEIEELVQEKEWLAVVDATHPYAEEVTENIKNACKHQGKEVLRLLRNRCGHTENGNVFYVDSAGEAAAYLNQTEGNIFLTTGSKEVTEYVKVIQDTSRIYVRILPGTEELEKCHQLGLKGKQIICMQGPFSEELNLAMLKEVDAVWLVTKETAGAGGYPQKLRAAERAGAKVVVIRRPEESGYSMEEVLEKLEITVTTKDNIAAEDNVIKASGEKKREIALVGIGMGNPGTLTMEACECIRESRLLIGAARMIDSIPEELKKGKEQFVSYKSQEIVSYIKSHPWQEKIAVLLSGDVGFYSGAKQLQELLGTEVKLVCGISSVVYFASRLGMSWEDMKLMSLHGRSQNIIGTLQQYEKVFTLTSGAAGIRMLCEELIQYGMKEVKVCLGRQLGTFEEEIEEGTPADFQDYDKSGLCVLVLVNEKAGRAVVTHGISDEDFLRDKVPMTKEEVRSISISKLGLQKNSVIYDIGAGTGSISVECAKMAVDGQVYAIEKKLEACRLIEENKCRFAAANLQLVSGKAPEVLKELPTPTHAFIGGSGGQLEEILKVLWEKNPQIRVVINAISLETIAEVTEFIKKYEFSQKEIVQVTVAKSKEIGNYQMMMGQNPVYVVTLMF